MKYLKNMKLFQKLGYMMLSGIRPFERVLNCAPKKEE